MSACTALIIAASAQYSTKPSAARQSGTANANSLRLAHRHPACGGEVLHHLHPTARPGDLEPPGAGRPAQPHHHRRIARGEVAARGRVLEDLSPAVHPEKE